ncbi:MAG: hypothetical protein CMM56_07490 [Rhodospirillaceae bacterium]|nr:hypothetical protein [Rhodospirillaceae bacterium]
MKLALAETFCSIQGEGHLTGKRMFFIRFAGCAVKECILHPSQENLCDTDWSVSEVLKGEDAIDKLANEALKIVGASGWVCITGGEPCDQPDALAFLASSIQRLGGKINIQTSGTHRVNAQWDWLTVSPKVPAAELKQSYGQELKVVVADQTDDQILDYYNNTRFWNYYLQPLWSDSNCNSDQTLALLNKLNDCGQPWELSPQVHKYLGVR